MPNSQRVNIRQKDIDRYIICFFIMWTLFAVVARNAVAQVTPIPNDVVQNALPSDKQAPSNYIVTVVKSGTGFGEIISAKSPEINCGVNCNNLTVTENSGTQITVRAEAATGSEFAGWEGGVCPDLGNPECTFTVNQESRIGAVFQSKQVSIQRSQPLYNTAADVTSSSPKDIVAIAAGEQFTVALQANGDLWHWGYYNSSPASIFSRIPVKIGSGFAKITAGTNHAFAIKPDGTLWGWGLNSSGQLGNGTTTSQQLPVQVGTGYTDIRAGNSHSIALKADGTLWSWGSNNYAQLGDGTEASKTLPVYVGRNFKEISAGYSHSLAIKTDGSLWAWGDNIYGQLGNGGTTKSILPVLIGQGFSYISATYGFGYPYEIFSFAIKTDGSLWGWGEMAMAN